MGNSEASVHPCESDGSVKVSLCGDCFAHPPDDYLVKGLIHPEHWSTVVRFHRAGAATSSGSKPQRESEGEDEGEGKEGGKSSSG